MLAKSTEFVAVEKYLFTQKRYLNVFSKFIFGRQKIDKAKLIERVLKSVELKISK